MKNILYFMIMFGTLVGMTLMYSTKGMAATMPQGEFAGINIEKGTANGVTYETGGVGLEERAARANRPSAWRRSFSFATSASRPTATSTTCPSADCATSFTITTRSSTSRRAPRSGPTSCRSFRPSRSIANVWTSRGDGAPEGSHPGGMIVPACI